eukprot:g35627.t1
MAQLAKIARGGWLPLHKLASILGLFVHVGTVLFYMRYTTSQFRLSYNALALKEAPGGYISRRASHAAGWASELLRRKNFRLPMADITRVGAFNPQTLVWEDDPKMITALVDANCLGENSASRWGKAWLIATPGPLQGFYSCREWSQSELRELVSTAGVPSSPAKELHNGLPSALEIAGTFQFNKVHIITDCKAAHAGIKSCYSREENLQNIIDSFTWELAETGVFVSASLVARDRLTVVDLLARGQVDAVAGEWSASNPSARSLRARRSSISSPGS